MKKTIITLIAIFAGSFMASTWASHNVRGYTNHYGNYVAPHRSMDPGEASGTGYSYYHNQVVPNRYYR
jgi:hypothetical protein